MKTTITNKRGEKLTLKVGSVIFFKRDYEQQGTVVTIQNGMVEVDTGEGYVWITGENIFEVITY